VPDFTLATLAKSALGSQFPDTFAERSITEGGSREIHDFSTSLVTERSRNRDKEIPKQFRVSSGGSAREIFA
jgi:hypothetical protein